MRSIDNPSGSIHIGNLQQSKPSMRTDFLISRENRRIGNDLTNFGFIQVTHPFRLLAPEMASPLWWSRWLFSSLTGVEVGVVVAIAAIAVAGTY